MSGSLTMASLTGKAKSPGTPKIASIPMSLRRRSTYSITVSDIVLLSGPTRSAGADAGILKIGQNGPEFGVGESANSRDIESDRQTVGAGDLDHLADEAVDDVGVLGAHRVEMLDPSLQRLFVGHPERHRVEASHRLGGLRRES